MADVANPIGHADRADVARALASAGGAAGAALEDSAGRTALDLAERIGDREAIQAALLAIAEKAEFEKIVAGKGAVGGRGRL